MKERNHFYTYFVGVRTVTTRAILDKRGKDTGETEDVTEWPEVTVTHCANIHDVAGKLHYDLDDVRYRHKERER